MKIKNQLMRFLIPLILACLLCACGSPEPREWIPLGGGAAEASSAAAFQTEPEASAEAPESTLLPEPETAAGPTEAAAAAESVFQTEEAAATRITEAPTFPQTESEINAAAPEPPTEAVPDRSPAASAEAPEEDAQVHYVANTNTKKFHLPSCSSVTDMKESNKLYFTGTREELIDQGYEPCKRCKP